MKYSDILYNCRERIIDVTKPGISALMLIYDGGENHVPEIRINMDCEGSEMSVGVLVLLSGNDTLDLRTFQKHSACGGKSRISVTSFLFGASRFDFSGKIEIGRGARGSDAFLHNENFILGEAAWAISRPYLEINTGDVKCSHSVVTGSLPNQLLEYLFSRGVSRKNAMGLLLSGTVEKQLEILPEEHRKDIAQKFVKKASAT